MLWEKFPNNSNDYGKHTWLYRDIKKMLFLQKTAKRKALRELVTADRQAKEKAEEEFPRIVEVNEILSHQEEKEEQPKTDDKATNVYFF